MARSSPAHDRVRLPHNLPSPTRHFAARAPRRRRAARACEDFSSSSRFSTGRFERTGPRSTRCRAQPSPLGAPVPYERHSAARPGGARPGGSSRDPARRSASATATRPGVFSRVVAARGRHTGAGGLAHARLRRPRAAAIGERSAGGEPVREPTQRPRASRASRPGALELSSDNCYAVWR